MYKKYSNLLSEIILLKVPDEEFPRENLKSYLSAILKLHVPLIILIITINLISILILYIFHQVHLSVAIKKLILLLFFYELTMILLTEIICKTSNHFDLLTQKPEIRKIVFKSALPFLSGLIFYNTPLVGPLFLTVSLILQIVYLFLQITTYYKLRLRKKIISFTGTIILSMFMFLIISGLIYKILIYLSRYLLKIL